MKAGWFEKCKEDPNPLVMARATDMAFILICQNEELKSAWASLNQKHSEINHEKTTIEYMLLHMI